MRRFDYDEREVLCRMVDESEEVVGAWQLQWLFFNIELLLDLIPH